MTTCVRPGCDGGIDETGYCDACGHQAQTGGSAVVSTRVAAEVSSPSSRRSRGADPLSLPVFDFPDPTSRILTDPQVPVRVRRCAAEGCPDPTALPPQSSGYCLACGAPFSFLPSLEPGDLVADQYRVVGCFARGGLGWIYLARDTHLDDNPVVLKGLIDVADADLATAERQALTTIDHPNIVRIFNFVSHPDARTGAPRTYIVMEYVDGLGLNEVVARSRGGNPPMGEPLRTEHVIAAGLQVLAAFEYLHERGLLYCDLKPDNVILRSGRHGERANRIKLIDLGAVRRVGDRSGKVVLTRGYQVPDAEIAERGLTVQSDLHTVGELLRRLQLATIDRPGQAGEGELRRIAEGVESFQLVCARALHADPDRRFASAADMADQLRGVLREIASLRDGVPRPEPSSRFTHTATLLDDGLGAVPDLRRWAADRPAAPPLDLGMPAPTAVAVGLPVPRPTADDPAADVLAAADADDPRRLLDRLADLRTPETAFLRCRAGLAALDLDAAAASLAQARELLDGRDWRLRWHDGLIALTGAKIALAAAAFADVRAELPGEDAPKLALAYCAEFHHDLAKAESRYLAVWRRDATVVSAVFGLARVRLADGDRDGAVALLDETPPASRYYDAARIAAVRVLSGVLAPYQPPSRAHLAAAAERLAQLYLDGGAPAGQSRVRLETAVHEAELAAAVAAGGDGQDGLRRRLERSYRALARQADTRAERSRLVDLANRYRPVTFR
ncbi:tetratricopeptide repeat protein [Actinokineospora sp. NPDC004072]